MTHRCIKGAISPETGLCLQLVLFVVPVMIFKYFIYLFHSSCDIYNLFSNCFYETLTVPIFPQAAGVLKLSSYYWFKGITQPLMQSWNSFRKSGCIHINRFLKDNTDFVGFLKFPTFILVIHQLLSETFYSDPCSLISQKYEVKKCPWYRKYRFNFGTLKNNPVSRDTICLNGDSFSSHQSSSK